MLDAVEVITTTSAVEIVNSTGTVEVINQAATAVEVIASAPAGGFGYLTQILPPTSVGTSSSAKIQNIPTTYQQICIVGRDVKVLTGSGGMQISLSSDNGVTFPAASSGGFSFILGNYANCFYIVIDAANSATANLTRGMWGSVMVASYAYAGVGAVNCIQIDAPGNFSGGTLALYGVTF